QLALELAQRSGLGAFADLRPDLVHQVLYQGRTEGLLAHDLRMELVAPGLCDAAPETLRHVVAAVRCAEDDDFAYAMGGGAAAPGFDGTAARIGTVRVRFATAGEGFGILGPCARRE